MANETEVENPAPAPRSLANIFNVVESVVLAMSVGLMLWVANLVVEHGRILAAHATLLQTTSTRLDSLENRGSAGLAAHVSSDDTRVDNLKTRVDKVENAIIALQSTPGDLKAISVRLETLKDGQERLEKALDAVAKKP